MKKAVITNVPWVNPDGTPTRYFSELVQSLSRNGLTQPVSTTEPLNGDVLTFNDTTDEWEPD